MVEVITPQQLVRKWRSLPHRLDFNVWNFETKIGKIAVETYQNAFHANRPMFPDKGAKEWAAISRDRARDCDDGYILYETGALCDSISAIIDSRGKDPRVVLFTDNKEFARHDRHPGFNFSKVHNEGIDIMPQRQFFPTNKSGLGSVVSDKIKEEYPMIFRGFPGQPR
jgi:hypothetical protein